MNLNKKQITKRNEIIKGMIEYAMCGFNVKTAQRNNLPEEEAIAKVECLLSNLENLKTLNSLVAAFVK